MHSYNIHGLVSVILQFDNQILCDQFKHSRVFHANEVDSFHEILDEFEE